jgi:glucosyl-dolichyl phosphate glucuronosyltransferase
VVIASRDRPELLRDCLETLAVASSHDPETAIEVVVVDDASAIPLAEAVGSVGGLDLRYVRQRGSGLSSARNAGIDQTTGEIVAFLDDDVFVAPTWCAAITSAIDAGSGAVAGRIVLQLAVERPRWLTQPRMSYLSEFDLGVTNKVLTSEPLGFGGNFAIRRDVLLEVGRFRTDLGRSAGSLLSNEEIDLLRRIQRDSYRIEYVAAALVTHRIPAERLSKAWFRQRAVAQGASDARAEPVHRSAGRRVARELWRCGRAAPILVLRLLDGHGPFDAVLWLDYCRGRIVQIVRDAKRLPQPSATP